jgi:3-methyladenine DNA glycosylase AlkC
MTKLRVALSSDSLQWRLVLDQEKIAHTVLDWQKPPTPENFPVLLLTSSKTKHRVALAKYINNGGVLIVDRNSKKDIDHTFPKERLIYIQDDVSKKISDISSCDKQFIFKGRELIETTAKTSKANIRIQVTNAIKQAFWIQNLPFVRVWYFPSEHEAAFSFRFDFDEYKKDDFDRTCRLLEEYRGSTTCFPCMKTYEDRQQLLERLASLKVDIGSHGYIHHVYNTYDLNDWNLAKAEAILRPYVATITGFSDRSYLYSSEFGLNYDDFPYFPINGNRFSSVLQIPTHPVCEGLFLQRYGYDEQFIDEYFEAIIANKVKNNETIFLFGHPTNRIGRYPFILKNIFKVIRSQKSVMMTNFGEFADWWRYRHEVPTDFSWISGRLITRSSGVDERITVEVCMNRKRRELIRLNRLEQIKFSRFASTTLNNEFELEVKHAIVTEMKIKYGLHKRAKKWVKKQIDWETKTPLNSLCVQNARDLVKFLLRSFYDALKSHTHEQGDRPLEMKG